MPVEIGTRFGAYEIGQLAGQGGMGEVYRARDSVLKRTVAIKILPSEFAHDADRVRRFQQEAEALAALNHVSIAAIHALEESNGVRFLVLEFVEGETLAERLRGRPLPQDDVLAIGQQICGALAAAHDRGIIHRDLKPANIKVGPDGQVKLLDFGLARMFVPDVGQADLSLSPTMTAASGGHVIAGTAAYMAPEQARGKIVDKRADMWALGCVLFEMLTGRPAFTGETVTDVLAAVVTQEGWRNALPSGTSPQLQWLIGRCLQKDPAVRFRDAADAAAVLAVAMEPAVATRSWPRWWAPAAAGVSGVVIAMAIAISYLRSAPPGAAIVRFDIPVTGAPITQPMAVSPDGRRFVFVAATGLSRSALSLRSLDALETTAIDGTDSGRALSTSRTASRNRRTVRSTQARSIRRRERA